jgi:hypothetical protein
MELQMDSPAIPVFLAGPFPVVYSSEIDEAEQEVELDVALLIAGLPTIVASTAFPWDDTWDRIRWHWRAAMRGSAWRACRTRRRTPRG